MPPTDPESRFEKVLERRLRSDAASDCPDAEILAAFHEGALSEAEADACGNHVKGCARCGEVIEALIASDALLLSEEESPDHPRNHRISWKGL